MTLGVSICTRQGKKNMHESRKTPIWSRAPVQTGTQAFPAVGLVSADKKLQVHQFQAVTCEMLALHFSPFRNRNSKYIQYIQKASFTVRLKRGGSPSCLKHILQQSFYSAWAGVLIIAVQTNMLERCFSALREDHNSNIHIPISVRSYPGDFL